jgi:hypothetical protein
LFEKVSSLKNWLGTMVTLVSILAPYDHTKYLEMLAPLDEGITHLAETLSLGDHKLIFNIWIERIANIKSQKDCVLE